MIGEIKEILNKGKDEETLKILKKNIMRIFVLMSKDKAFIKLMKNINSLENFIFLLKCDLELYEDTQTNIITQNTEIGIIVNLLPDFIILVLTILRNYDLSQFYINPISVNVSSYLNDENKSIVINYFRKIVRMQ